MAEAANRVAAPISYEALSTGIIFTGLQFNLVVEVGQSVGELQRGPAGICAFGGKADFGSSGMSPYDPIADIERVPGFSTTGPVCTENSNSDIMVMQFGRPYKTDEDFVTYRTGVMRTGTSRHSASSWRARWTPRATARLCCRWRRSGRDYRSMPPRRPLTRSGLS
jgi:hypothetical protein